MSSRRKKQLSPVVASCLRLLPLEASTEKELLAKVGQLMLATWPLVNGHRRER